MSEQAPRARERELRKARIRRRRLIVVGGLVGVFITVLTGIVVATATPHRQASAKPGTTPTPPPASTLPAASTPPPPPPPPTPHHPPPSHHPPRPRPPQLPRRRWRLTARHTRSTIRQVSGLWSTKPVP